MRFGVILMLAVFVLGALAAEAALTASYWPVARVMRAIDDASVTVEGRKVRIDSTTTLCSGAGASRRDGGVRRWRRFRCTYTTFAKGVVDRDLDFDVRVLDARRFRITEAAWVPESR
jgi:hypothetical protein